MLTLVIPPHILDFCTAIWRADLPGNEPTPTHASSNWPRCPLNVKEQDWDTLLSDLSNELTLPAWCEAVSCGFSKTPMGQMAGRMWHDILIEKQDLSYLPEADRLLLLQILEHVWNESALDPIVPVANEPVNAAGIDAANLLAGISQNRLGEVIARIRDANAGQFWSGLEVITGLENRLTNDLPFLNGHKPELALKIFRFLCYIEENMLQQNTREKWHPRITEPVYQQIKTHLWAHMADLNWNRPSADAGEMINTWDETDIAAIAMRAAPADDVLSRFCALAEIADYG